LNPKGGNKKNSEWVLADWAVVKGIESTTRYRPQTKRRSGSNQAKVSGTATARANSGRKGGIIARKTRASAARKSMGRDLHSQSLLIDNLAYRHDMPRDNYYNRSLAYPRAPGAKVEPITPPEMNSVHILMHTNSNSQAYAYTNGHEYSQHHPYPPLTSYAVSDVGSVYTTDASTPNTLRGHAGPAPGLPTEYGQIFSHTNEGGNVGRPAYNMPWGDTGAGGTYYN
jgi:hypothetical protein